MLPMPGFVAPKLLWLKRHEPQNWSAMAGLLMPKDYVRFWLTGEKATDMVDAAGAWLLDQASRGWNAGALAALGLPHRCCRHSTNPSRPLGG